MYRGRAARIRSVAEYVCRMLPGRTLLLLTHIAVVKFNVAGRALYAGGHVHYAAFDAPQLVDSTPKKRTDL